MKQLLTSSISTTVGFPIKSGTLDFLQNANSEMFAAIVRGLLGREYLANTPYAIYGCNNTGSGSVYNIQDGVILFNGVLYFVSATSFTLTAGNDVFLAISTSYYTGSTADPVTFTDGVARNVHADSTLLVYQSNLSPSPLAGFAYSGLKFAVQPTVKGLTPTTNFTSSVLEYWRNRDGVVMLGGYIQCSAGSTVGATIATLPSGYTPAYNQVFSVSRSSSALTTVNGAIVRILSTGEIQIYASGTLSNGDILPIGGLSFRNYQ